MCAETETHVHHSVPCVCDEQKSEARFHSSRVDTVESEQWFHCGGEDADIRDHLCGLSNKAAGDNAVVESVRRCQQNSLFFFASGRTTSRS
jgi:hypothetical protein